MVARGQLIGGTMWLGLLLGACVAPESGESSDSSTTSCVRGALGCKCDSEASCDGDLICAQGICIVDDVVNTSTGSTTDMTTETTSSTTNDPTTTESETTSVPTTGPFECEPADIVSDDCNEEGEPYCSPDGMCVSCADIDCALVDPETPACDAVSGLCVGCTAEELYSCPEDNPVCDVENNTCVPCQRIEECPNSACNLELGYCLPLDNQLWVEGEGDCSDNHPGTSDKPVCTIGKAVELASAPDTVVMVRGGHYNEHILVDGKIIVIRRAPGSSEVVVGSEVGYTIDVIGGSSLILADITFRGADNGLMCTTSTVMFDRMVFDDHATYGLFSDSCNLYFRRSIMTDAGIAGLELRGGVLEIENSFVTNNGFDSNVEGGGISADQGAIIRANYVTLYNNLGTIGEFASVVCGTNGDDPEIDIRNSVIFGASHDSLDVIRCELFVKDSGYDWLNGMLPPAWDNIAMLTDDNIDNYLEVGAMGVVRAVDGEANPLSQLAHWQPGDPRHDFESDPRPDMEGAEDYAGADVAQ